MRTDTSESQMAASTEKNQTHRVGPPYRGFPPERAEFNDGRQDLLGSSMRMYTEEEVSELLQVSLLQLRKWRMKRNLDSVQGPHFRKIGRLVRYPGNALRSFIDGE